ncbi:MAG: hypothetical protein HY867_01040 [Chloroflexi bacterium]|nr:hypothetical protein [Chloroflexota bacterium]
MTLQPQDGALFFQLMWKLQHHVNQKLGFHKGVSTFEEYASLPTKKKLQARDALWEHPELIDSFVNENPNNLPDEELEIVRRWKGFVKGSFFIFRHLKKGTIFIGEKDGVYSVHGILDPLDELIPSYALPQMAQAILLPFKGQITYDGLLSGYNVHFGGGIRSNLNHTYMTAKTRDRIISTLEPEYEEAKPIKPKKNILPHLQELAASAEKLKSDSALQNAALNLTRTAIALAICDAEGDGLQGDDLSEKTKKIRRDFNKLLKVLDSLDADWE